MKNTSYTDSPCPRCGSKQKIARTWKEKIPMYSGGFTIAECTQIVCTNKECQKEFDINLEKENQKRSLQRSQKEERDKERENLKAAKKKAYEKTL